MSFLLVKAMTNGGPDGASNVFLSYMYQEAYTNSSYGYGMAIGVMAVSYTHLDVYKRQILNVSYIGPMIFLSRLTTFRTDTTFCF